MPRNPKDRYWVVRPHNLKVTGEYEPGCDVGYYKLIDEARKVRDEDWHDQTWIWDSQGKNIVEGQTGREVK